MGAAGRRRRCFAAGRAIGVTDRAGHRLRIWLDDPGSLLEREETGDVLLMRDSNGRVVGLEVRQPAPGADDTAIRAPTVVTVSPGAFSWAAIARVLLAVLLVWVLVKTWQLWLLLFIALIVAAAILPVARLGDRVRIPRIVTVVGIYLAVTLIVGVLGRLLVPALVLQGKQFLSQLPVLLERARAWIASVIAWGERWNVPLPVIPGSGGGELDLGGLGQLLVQNTLSATAGVIGATVGFLVIVIVAAYLVLDAERIGRGLLALLPSGTRERVAEVADPVLTVIGQYVLGQAAVSLCVGVIIASGLALLGVPYALLIGSIAAMLNVIPFLGSPAAAILGVLSALNLSPTLALWAALLFWGTNLVEGKLLVPYFVGRATGLHPLAVLLGILAGVQLAGVIGALVAIPLLAGAWEAFRRLHVEPPGRQAAPAVGR